MKLPELTDLQVDILNVLWSRGEASSQDVQEELRPTRKLAHSTIATMLSRLERKGFVAHRRNGRQYIYSPAVDRAQVRHGLIANFTERACKLFENNLSGLVSQLLSETSVSASELRRARELLIEAEKRQRKAEPES